ncbi:MAG: thioredoxin family protein [Firmicutes bacterium]|nr:thioredoxin family protein [Bacillota bacterium]
MLLINIKILGVEGCPNCTAMVQTTINIWSELQIAAGVEKVTDKKMVESFGPGAIPGFVINGKLKAGGKLPTSTMKGLPFRSRKGIFTYPIFRRITPPQ